MEHFFFNSFASLLRTVLIAICAYAGLIAFLRISGKRTLSKMNAFDLVVTVALGSTLATVLLNKNVPLIEGFAAFAMLILLQYVVALCSVYFPWTQAIVKSEPTLLVHQGRMLKAQLRSQRVTEEEVLAAARSQGIGDLAEIAAVVLETDGSFSIVSGSGTGESSTLRNVRYSERQED